MNKIAILTIGLFTVGMVSCKKCQECTTTTTQDYGSGTPIVVSVSDEYCGDDYDSAPAEVNVTQDVGGGVMQTVVIVCEDK